MVVYGLTSSCKAVNVGYIRINDVMFSCAGIEKNHHKGGLQDFIHTRPAHEKRSAAKHNDRSSFHFAEIDQLERCQTASR